MAGENLARIVRERAATLARRAAADRRNCGDPEGADVISDLADEIAAIPIGGAAAPQQETL